MLRSEKSPAGLDFHECSNVSPFGNLEKNSSSHGHISPQRPKTKSNPIFQHCIGKMQNLNRNTNNEPSKEHGLIRDETEQSALRHDLDGHFTSSKSADLRIRNMGDQVARLKLGVERNSQEVHEASGVRGVTGPRGSTGIVPPHFSGFGRARLAAEARKNNFGGISSSPPKAAGKWWFACLLVSVVVVDVFVFSNDRCKVEPTRCREGMARAFCLLSKRTSPRA